MPKVKEKNIDNHQALLSAIEEIKRKTNDNQDFDKKKSNITNRHGIVDIITFCNSPQYLNLPENNLRLWLPQRVILKSFYMGTMGNENVDFTDEEWQWLKDNSEDEQRDGVVYQKNCDKVIEKILTMRRQQQGDEPEEKHYFNVLQLVLGRRGTKTLLASIITVYEAYKLLIINNGDPHGYFNLPYGAEIAIINVALALDQAGRLFREIKERLRGSPFFKDRISHPTTTSVYLLTDRDLRLKAEGSPLAVDGSVLLLCGHSNPDTLRGYSCILLLFDEIAHFDESGKVKGSKFYEDLSPSLAKFYKYNNARVVMISSPNARHGIFYDTFDQSSEDDAILSYQLPTWCINEDITYDHAELARARKRNIDSFVVEYGAQWATGGSIGKFFDEGQIGRCLRVDIGPHKRPENGFNYYLHVDPAITSDNYCAVLVAAKRYTNSMGKRRTRCYLANTWVWRPQAGIGLQFHLLDKEIIKICSIFHPMVVSYDDYQSVESIQKLRSHGINTRRMMYNRGIKQKVYQNLRMLMTYEPNPELFLYEDGADASMLVEELKNLRYKRIQRGISIIPDKDADVNTDDLSDCLAGACANATNGIQPSLPTPVVVRTGYV